MADSYRIVEKAPGWRSVDPLPSEQELADFYTKEYFQELVSKSYKDIYSSEEIEYKRLRSKVMLESIKERVGKKPGNLLEIGCGEGFLLDVAAGDGWAVEGVDFSSHAVETFNAHLLSRIRTGDVYAILDKRLQASNRSVDLCVLQNVLEHVRDSDRLLRYLPRLLSRGGAAAITVPNDFTVLQEAAIADELVDKEYWVCPPQHLHYFTLEGLSAIVEGAGLQVVDAYGDFPIEWFLFHSGSNYVRNGTCGPAAHSARVRLERLMAEQGIGAYLAFCRALTGCGMGRTVTVIAASRD